MYVSGYISQAFARRYKTIAHRLLEHNILDVYGGQDREEYTYCTPLTKPSYTRIHLDSDTTHSSLPLTTQRTFPTSKQGLVSQQKVKDTLDRKAELVEA